MPASTKEMLRTGFGNDVGALDPTWVKPTRDAEIIAAHRTEPIRVLKVVPTLLCGGTEKQFMTLGRSLDKERFALQFACLRRWGPFVKDLDDQGIPLSEYRINTFRSLRAIRQQARLARHIARARVQIVHAYNFYGNVFAIPPARAAAPVVIASIRDRGPYLTPMQKLVQRYVCRLADCVLVNAAAVRDWLIADGFNPSRIVVIRNGVDLSLFGTPPDPGWIRRELGLPAGGPLVAVVSRLTPLKGLDHFLEAAAMLKPRFPDARFLVIGYSSASDDEYINGLVRLVARLRIADRVIFPGLRFDVPALLASVDVSVMPSLNEALSNVLLESMAAGAPVVATHVGGTTEALTDGVNGLLVPPGDSAALARAVARLLEDHALAARVGRAARATIVQRFPIERMVRATEDLYLELLDRKRRMPRRGHVGVAELPCSTETVKDPAVLHALGSQWNDLVERAGVPHPFMRHEWIRTWWECFGGDRRLHILIVRSGDRLTAIAPLMKERVRMYGVPIRRIGFLQNDHTPRADFIVAERPRESYEAIWKALLDDREQWDVVQLNQLVADSPTRDEAFRWANRHDLATGVWRCEASPYLALAGSWDQFRRGLTAKLRQNFRNRDARLRRMGEPALETIAERTAIQRALDDAIRLEASGWKRETSTAIGSDLAVQRFYTTLADRAAEAGWVRLLFLTVGGVRIATAYAAAYRNRLFLLKTGYDPAYASCAPFRMLTSLAIEQAFADEVAEFDFMGGAEAWKLEWTSSTRPHDWLFIFSRTPAARLLYGLKFGLRPALDRWRK
ncbi:MAG: GNAT family N-acetyltransferase [Acidobacteria bacterium]|nr:GNAT family N-acetyltransferase [Acidobacteriota bacterium]